MAINETNIERTEARNANLEVAWGENERGEKYGILSSDTAMRTLDPSRAEFAEQYISSGGHFVEERLTVYARLLGKTGDPRFDRNIRIDFRGKLALILNQAIREKRQQFTFTPKAAVIKYFPNRTTGEMTFGIRINRKDQFEYKAEDAFRTYAGNTDFADLKNLFLAAVDETDGIDLDF